LIDPGAQKTDFLISVSAPVGGICSPPSPSTRRRISLLWSLWPGMIHRAVVASPAARFGRKSSRSPDCLHISPVTGIAVLRQERLEPAARSPTWPVAGGGSLLWAATPGGNTHRARKSTNLLMRRSYPCPVCLTRGPRRQRSAAFCAFCPAKGNS
jgi:hypothetical protein